MNREEREKLHRRRGFLPDLIFAWKVGRSGDFGRLVLAFLLVSFGFAGAAVLVDVRGKDSVGRMSPRETASVMILRPDDDASRRLLDWAREQSPFPDRWVPQGTEGAEQSIAQLEGDLRAASRYVPKLRPAGSYAEESVNPPLLNLWPTELPPPNTSQASAMISERAQTVRVVVESKDEFSERWRPLETSWPGLDYYNLLGQNGRFVIGVDEQGAVVFCLAAEGLDPVLDRDLQAWIRRHTLKPSEKEGVVWTTVTVRVLAADLTLEKLEPGDESEGGAND